MPLPILQDNRTPSADDLVRLFHRAVLHWSRHLGEETTLEVGTALCNPNLSSILDANRMLDVALPQEMTPPEAHEMVAEHFRSQGARCWNWVMAPAADVSRTEPMVQYLLAQGYRRSTHEIFYLGQITSSRVQETRGLTIIPSRASFRHMRALAEQSAAECGAPQLAQAMMMHLDDSHTDALLALKEQEAAGCVSVLAVGDIGLIEDVYVTSRLRRRGIATTLMNRALEICARSLFRHVFVAVEPANEVAKQLYWRFGFRPIGPFVGYSARAQDGTVA